ncbi:MAG TPA: pyrroline-5-carboxylate reductase [Acidimicrobiales bacterium]|nr:pyrroline-5-carboxylate reductase [Acidimicrobiales bacterium]
MGDQPGDNPTLVVVGGGRMGFALVKGLTSRSRGPGDGRVPDGAVDRAREQAEGHEDQPSERRHYSELLIVEPDDRRREELESELGQLSDVRLSPRVVEAGDAILAVKPKDAEVAARQLASSGARRVLSVVAGIRCSSLESWLGKRAVVVRSMPNTPALLGHGISALSGGSNATEDDLRWAEGLLGEVGEVVRVPEESLDAVTGLSGSGPAYVFLVAEALIEAGVLAGLPRPVSEKLAIGTMNGATRMLAESGESPEALRAQVTSPGGTTAEGIRVLEARAVRSAFFEAVAAASRRSAELAN